MSWLVTGGGGRIGSALLERLAGEVEVVAAVRGAGGAARLRSVLGPGARQALASGTLQPFHWDVSAELPDPVRLRRLGVEGVVHLAARTRFDDPDGRSAAINVEGALMAARTAAALRVPLFHVSTAYVSGRTEGIATESLEAIGAPRNVYEETKAAAERALFAYARRVGLRLACFRPGIVLPAAPRRVDRERPPAVGPLVHLRLLLRLDARRSTPALLRHPGDPSATLSVVDLETVVSVLAQAVARPDVPAGIYHVVAERPLTVGEVTDMVHEQLAGLRVVLTGSGDVPDADRLERIALEHLAPFVPYLFGKVLHDRRRLERDFEVPSGPSSDHWRGVFARHAAAWRSGSAGHATARGEVADYFDRFLPSLIGRRLVPGLESLTESFTVAVPEVGCWRLEIERGALRRVEPSAGLLGTFHFETDGEAFLAAASGHRRPAQLFFEERVRIEGDLKRALRTAAALEEFFARFPYRAGALSA